MKKILFTPPISLEFQSQVLGFDAPSEAFEFPQATYKITVWIEGEEKTLSQVRKVTYSLPSPTHLQEFVQDSPKDGFRYSYTGKAQMVFGGTSSSEQIKAKVELNNGQVMSLSRGADKDEGQSK